MGTVEVMSVQLFLLNAKVLLTFLGGCLKSALLSLGDMHPKIFISKKKEFKSLGLLTPPDTG